MVRALTEGEYDAVISDIRLPDVDGMEFINLLKKSDADLPIIILTAYGGIKSAIEATKLGAYDYLLKPFEIPQLLDLIHRAVNSNRLMSEPVTLGEPGEARQCGREQTGGPKAPGEQGREQEIGRRGDAQKPEMVQPGHQDIQDQQVGVACGNLL